MEPLVYAGRGIHISDFNEKELEDIFDFFKRICDGALGTQQKQAVEKRLTLTLPMTPGGTAMRDWFTKIVHKLLVRREYHLCCENDEVQFF